MCKDSEKDCNTCRHNPGCLKKGLAVFLLFIQTGRDRELSRDPDGHLKTAFGAGTGRRKRHELHWRRPVLRAAVPGVQRHSVEWALWKS